MPKHEFRAALMLDKEDAALAEREFVMLWENAGPHEFPERRVRPTKFRFYDPFILDWVDVPRGLFNTEQIVKMCKVIGEGLL